MSDHLCPNCGPITDGDIDFSHSEESEMCAHCGAVEEDMVPLVNAYRFLKSELAARDKEIVALRDILRRTLDEVSGDHYCLSDSLYDDIESAANNCPVREAAINRVRADAILEAIKQDLETVCDSVSREYINGMADGVEQYEKHLEEYANKLLNPDQANREV